MGRVAGVSPAAVGHIIPFVHAQHVAGQVQHMDVIKLTHAHADTAHPTRQIRVQMC